METTLQLVLDGIGGGLVSILRISLILIPVMVVMSNQSRSISHSNYFSLKLISHDGSIN